MDEMLTTLMSETFHAILSRLVEAIGALQTTPGSTTLNSAYTALISVSPLFLIVLGVITFFAGALAKFIGVIIIIIGIVLLAIPYLGFIH
jgi:NAD/NADP transhydrogenase alpha subunit